MSLIEYVQANVSRGDCKCGECIDRVADPQQPFGHTADLIFFEVTKSEDADADTYRALVETEYPHWLDGSEHSYMEIGANVGDQGLGMMAMGLGSLLGLWALITPKALGVSEELVVQMAGMGMVSIMVGFEMPSQEGKPMRLPGA